MRVVELHEIFHDYLIHDPHCHLKWKTWQNSKLPIITRVCCESRAVALESGNVTEGIPRLEYKCSSFHDQTLAWVGPRHSIVAWYWGLAWDNWAYSYVGPRSEDLSCFPRYAATACGRLILARRIHFFHYFDGPGDYESLDATSVSEISKWKDWLACLKVVALNQTAEQAFNSDL